MDRLSSPQLLDAFPLIRSRNVEEVSERMSRIFSPHRLKLRGQADQFRAQHNQVRLRDVSINVLHYGADVIIDPGERGDFYLVQLPLSGHAQLICGHEEIDVDPDVLSVLQPQVKSLMRWSGDCSMILMQVPRSLAHRRAAEWGAGPHPRFAFSRSRHDPDVSAWWQAVFDLTHNIHRNGAQWLNHPAAFTAMEEFLLSIFTSMLRERDAAPASCRADARCLRRAKDYIHANVERTLTLAEIARHAYVCPRTLEAAFKRHGEVSPLAYARRHRLQAVHDALLAGSRSGQAPSVTEVAFAHGFLHMGRFAAQYRAQFGCSPSETRKPH